MKRFSTGLLTLAFLVGTPLALYAQDDAPAQQPAPQPEVLDRGQRRHETEVFVDERGRLDAFRLGLDLAPFPLQQTSNICLVPRSKLC